MDNFKVAVPGNKEISTPENSGKWDNSHSRDHVPNPTQSKVLIDLALDFLSTSSNEALLCAFAFLIAATFIILGRVGLLLSGLVLGIILHASWEGVGNGSANDAKRKRELALEVSRRLLDWPQPKSNEIGKEDDAKTTEETSETDLDYSTFKPATAAALRSLTDATIDNYVK